MNSIPDTTISDPSSNAPREIAPAEVEQALATILADDKFAAAPQMSAFLAYVVKQTLRGEADRIKAYTVAVDALGKPATFDPQNDPSVRVLAKRLRSSIDHYYGRTMGHSVIIELKSGSYKPRFVRADSLDTVDEAAQGTDALETTRRHETAGTHDALQGEPHAATESEQAAILETAGINAADQSRQAPDGRSGSSESARAPEGREPMTNAVGTSRHGGRRNLATALRRIPHPAMTAITVLAIGWGITQQQQESRLRNELASIAGGGAVMMGDQPLQLALASVSDGQSLRARPALPTVHLPSMVDQEALDATVSASITRVLSRFENIEVIRQHNLTLAQWPEDYELHFSDYQLGNRVRIEAQLLHAATGRVVSVDTFDLPDLAQDKLTAAELAGIEGFAARLAQSNGPLIRDYLAQSDLSPAVACALGADPEELMLRHDDKRTTEPTQDSDLATGPDTDTPRKGAYDCERFTAGTVQKSTMDLTQEAGSLLGSLHQLSGPARERSLGKALALAQRAVELSPFSATARTTLMNSLQETGKHDEALTQGELALAYNRFDTTILRSLARVMDSLDLADDSASLRAEAARLDPDGSSAMALNRG